MYVSNLDRPWLETPFVFQGFEVRDRVDIEMLQSYCSVVYIDVDRGDLSPAQVQQLRGTLEGWDCRDIRLEADIISISMLTGELGDTVRATPTRLTGSTEQIDAAIEAGRRTALARPSLRTLAAP